MKDIPKVRQLYFSHLLDVSREHFKQKIESHGDALLNLVMLRLSKPTYHQMVSELQSIYDNYLLAMTYDLHSAV
jgi:hypothetical protein